VAARLNARMQDKGIPLRFRLRNKRALLQVEVEDRELSVTECNRSYPG
jgi:hypothetical protein